MHFRQRGFGLIGIVLVVVAVLGLLVAIGWQVYDSHYRKTISSPPHSTSMPVSPRPNRIVAIGDIVCDPQDKHITTPDKAHCQDKKVIQRVKEARPDAILALGDIQYSNGSLSKFQNSFAKQWGSLKSIIYPTPGNHEYFTPQAEGYYTYFKDSPIDTSKGYYDFTLGRWKILSLNSNCDKIGGCSATSRQLTWLEEVLDREPAPCTLAFWHHPRFTSGEYSTDAVSKSRSDAFWPKLSAHKTDIVLNGHDHLYERFAPQDARGKPIADGMRQFTIGTGGKSLYERTMTTANSEKIIDNHFGILIIDLYPNSYKWEFKSTESKILDSGQQECH